jgi:NADH:ubiquinone oxidoreductase subunit E
MTSGKEKTIGELIDSLITTDLRCWMAQEDIMNESLSTEQRLAAAIRAQEQNAKRSQLISAINEVFGEKGFTGTKTYTYFKERE